MAVQTRAGIELYQSALRYAALERKEGAVRLRRLGRCDFDFDAETSILSENQPPHLGSVVEAIRDVFSGIQVKHFYVSLHPSDCISFFSPVPASASPSERHEQLHWEAVQLLGAEQMFKIVVHPVREGETDDGKKVEWYHVLAIERHVYENYVQLLQEAFPDAVLHFNGTAQAAAKVAVRKERDERDTENFASCAFVIGQYPSHWEFTLCREGMWMGSTVALEDEEADGTYHAARMLDQFGVPFREITDFFHYGAGLNANSLDSIAELISTELIPLNPFATLDMESGRLEEEAVSHWAYVPAVGVAL